MRTKPKVPAGWRRLKSTDIIRVGDCEWCNNYIDIPMPVEGSTVLVHEDSPYCNKTLNDFLGDSLSHGNDFYRRLNAKI